MQQPSPAPRSRPRSRAAGCLSWISGDYPDDNAEKVDSGAVAPPDQAVRLEILRLELAARVATLQAEADAMRADDMVDGITRASATDVAVDDATTDDDDRRRRRRDLRGHRCPLAGIAADAEPDPIEDAAAST